MHQLSTKPEKGNPIMARASFAAALSFLVILLARPVPATAQAKELGWSFTGRLTTVFTGGNSDSNTFGIAST